jgi:hypothetical protein
VTAERQHSPASPRRRGVGRTLFARGEGRSTLRNRDAKMILRECLLAVRSARKASLVVDGWQQLQVRNAEGSIVGTIPYTEDALRIFEKAYLEGSENHRLLQHLAIATHALAWDLELARDPQAAPAWRQAFQYWRELAASREFWQELKEKFLEIEKEGDPAFLDQARRSLLEELLDIHVEFVRYWTESGFPEQCEVHLEIIRSALLPPAVKKQFAAKVYDILTAGVNDALNSQAYQSALTSMENYLQLFPDFLPALRQTAEISRDWLSQKLSFQEHWDEIIRLSERIHEHMVALARHPEIEQDPLAAVKLDSLAEEFAIRGYHRGIKYGTPEENSLLAISAIEEASFCYSFSLNWCRLSVQYSPSGSQLRLLMSRSLNNLAVVKSHEIAEIRTYPASSTRTRTLKRLYRECIQSIQEAIKIYGEEPLYLKNLEYFQSELDKLEVSYTLNSLGSDQDEEWYEQDDEDDEDEEDDDFED